MEVSVVGMGSVSLATKGRDVSTERTYSTMLTYEHLVQHP